MTEHMTSNGEAVTRIPASEWHYAPDLPIGNNPLFEFPWRIDRILSYYREYWLSLSETVVFLLFAVILGALGWWMSRREQVKAVRAVEEKAPPAVQETPEASWDDVQLVDTLGLEVGHRLIPLVDARQQGELLGRIKSVRKKFAQEVGFLPPVVHIRDNLELDASTYRVTLKGAEIGRAEAWPGRWLARSSGGLWTRTRKE